MTAMNAASSIDITKLGDSPSPWANPYTGSAGVISNISETRSGDIICRDFMTTRHSYSGIDSFRGKTCLTGSGQWTLLNFDKQG
jgi:17 kDa outer membrane surface antigen